MLVTLLAWLLGKASRVLAAASAALGSIARSLGVSIELQSTVCQDLDRPPKGTRHVALTGSEEPAASAGRVATGSRVDRAAQEARAEFLHAAGPAYGYHGRGEALAREFSRLGDKVYVDHAGATLYSQRQLRETHEVCSCLLPCMLAPGTGMHAVSRDEVPQGTPCPRCTSALDSASTCRTHCLAMSSEVRLAPRGCQRVQRPDACFFTGALPLLPGRTSPAACTPTRTAGTPPGTATQGRSRWRRRRARSPSPCAARALTSTSASSRPAQRVHLRPSAASADSAHRTNCGGWEMAADASCCKRMQHESSSAGLCLLSMGCEPAPLAHPLPV